MITFKWKSALELSSRTIPSIDGTQGTDCAITFVVEFRPDTDDTWTIRRQMDSTQIVLRDLDFNCIYVVRVKAVSNTGASEYSPEMTFNTWPLREWTLSNQCRGLCLHRFSFQPQKLRSSLKSIVKDKGTSIRCNGQVPGSAKRTRLSLTR